MSQAALRLEDARCTQRVSWTEATAVAVGTSMLFLVFYGVASYLTSLRSDVGTWYYEWERLIPFVPLMIVPYMSIDLFFFAAPFTCRDREELRVLAWRLAAVVVLAALCFLIYPLRLAVDRPVAEGFFGGIYNWFTALDRPYNLCPSMHIALRTVLAAHYGKHCRGWLRVGMNFWFFLIGCSTLLLYQHHVIDVVGGFVLAAIVMYVFDGLPWRLPKTGGGTYAQRYAAASILLAVPVIWAPKLGWLTLWPAASCAFIAVGYGWAGPAVYRRRDGRISWPARWVLGPVLAAQWLSWKYYSAKSANMDHVGEGVWIGRRLSEREARKAVDARIAAVIDVCSELNEPNSFRHIKRLELPILDLTAPTQDQLDVAVEFIEANRDRGVLVHCKAGYSRSAALVAAWLVRSGRVRSAEEAFAKLCSIRSQIVIRDEIRNTRFRCDAALATAP